MITHDNPLNTHVAFLPYIHAHVAAHDLWPCSIRPLTSLLQQCIVHADSSLWSVDPQNEQCCHAAADSSAWRLWQLVQPAHSYQRPARSRSKGCYRAAKPVKWREVCLQRQGHRHGCSRRYAEPRRQAVVCRSLDIYGLNQLREAASDLHANAIAAAARAREGGRQAVRQRRGWRGPIAVVRPTAWHVAGYESAC